MKIMRKFLAQVVLAALLITGIVPDTVMTARAEETAFFVVPEEKEEIASVSELTPSEADEEGGTEEEELPDEETGAELSLSAEPAEILQGAGETLAGAGIATPSEADAVEAMTDYFVSVGCKNTSEKDVSSFWNMLALASLGEQTSTETDYSKVNFIKLNVQVISKYMIAMFNDGVDPYQYTVTPEGESPVNLVAYLKSCMGTDGGFGNPAISEKAAYNKQSFVILALWLAGETVDQKAADWFAAGQDANGILGPAAFKSPDATAWAITYCDLAGINFPKKAEALTYMSSHLYTKDDSNAFACYMDYLVNAGDALDSDEEHLLAHYFDRLLSADGSKWMYGFRWQENTASKKTFNLTSTQQCTVALGEYALGKSVYETIKENKAIVKEPGAQPGSNNPPAESNITAKVTVRLADSKGVNLTEDILPRMELTVTKGSGNVFTGINQSSEGGVTLYDVFAEAVYASLNKKKDPTFSQVTGAAAKINGKLVFSTEGWITSYFGYTDYNCGYYMNGDTYLYSPAAEVSDGDDVILYHFIYPDADYAFFDAVTYHATTKDAAEVCVQREYYGLDYSLITAGIPAVIVAKGTDKTRRFLCDDDGNATLTGLAAGHYDLTAEYGVAGKYIVTPYADLIVTEYVPQPTPAPDPAPASEDSGSTALVYGIPVKTGTWNDPVIDGTWKQNADGSWTYTTNALFRSTWGYILNPYAKGTEKNQWFYFDTNGKMLIGWQVIGGKWYYLNTAADGSQGACLLNTTTPDGYTVNENGEWTVNGVVQTAGAAASAAQANGTQASASGTASKAGTSAGSSSGSGEEKPKTYSFSVSISANVKTDAGAQVDFSGSKTIKAEEDETYTAYDALESLCADKGYAIEGGASYVSAINGLGEFDAGPTSGWMYSVNGKYPNVPAGDYEVKKGDKIRWVYVTKYTEVTENF